MPTRTVPERFTARFSRNPIRWAWISIATVTVATVFAGSLIVWLGSDPQFQSFGNSVWWALQTMTTVGYGDVVPTTAQSKVVGGVIMVVGVSFVAVTTAIITGAVVEAARKKRRRDEDPVLTELNTLRGEVATLTAMVAELREALPKGGPGN